jgi:hypothetical protein
VWVTDNMSVYNHPSYVNSVSGIYEHGYIATRNPEAVVVQLEPLYRHAGVQERVRHGPDLRHRWVEQRFGQ